MKINDIISLGYNYNELDPKTSSVDLTSFTKSEKQVKFKLFGNEESGFVLTSFVQTRSGYNLCLGSSEINTIEDLVKLENIYRRISVVCEDQ